VNASEARCRLTILGMFHDPEGLENNRSCYLVTLTFPDPEPTVEQGMAMWDSFKTGVLAKHGYVGVRVFERGEQHGRLHIHVVTWQRWDAKMLWERGRAYGFGRVDIRERPLSRACYAAKYLTKPARFPLPKRTRKWACFGFQGTRREDCVWEIKSCVLVAECPQERPERTWIMHNPDHEHTTCTKEVGHIDIPF